MAEPATRDVIAAANDTRRPLEPDERLDVLFAAQAARTPEAAAVVVEGEVTSYSQLESRAAMIAGRLAAAGARPGDRIGVCGAPSPAVVAALLGILRAGACYVPLEPTWPPDRLRFIAGDCGIELVVSDEEHAGLVAELGLTAVPAEGERGPSPPAPPARQPDDLAYVLYTSGSTGAPKGVGVPHRGVNRLVAGAPDYVELGPGCRFLWLSPLTFDASVIEIWGPLLTGGAIVVMPPGQPLLERLAETIRDENVTAALFISPQLHLVVDRDPGELRGIHHVLVGGDVLSADHVRRLLESGVVDEVVHCYGPTESTLFATIDVISEVGAGETSLPIGRPIENTTCHVVDDQLRPLPVGEPGELLIGGLGLADGYVNRPELTAERFIANPLPEASAGERLYRTGDLARWRGDGRLEFLGRIDDQVKIRGYRIEPAEIEAVLRDHPGIDDCVVLARADETGHRRLVAYLAGPRELDVSALREVVAERLPAYMVPAAWVVLDALPLTQNNKVDRASLPDPNGVPASTASAQAMPQGELEAAIARHFAAILRLGEVGRDDGFFELGGDSLLVTELVARIGDEAGVRIPLDTLAAAPTPATLARAIERIRETASEYAFPAPVPQPRDPAAALSVSQQQIAFLNDLDPESVAYQFQAIIWLEGDLSVAALEQALGGIVERHEIYRTTFASGGGEWTAHVHEPFGVRLEIEDVSAREDPGAAAAELAERRFRERIPIDRLPLARWRLVKVEEGRHALLHQEHHLIHDGWSMMIFLRELRDLYTAAVENRSPGLPPASLQFRDFAAWQRLLLETEIADAQLRYWRDRLEDPPAPLELPYDAPRPARQTFAGDQVCATITHDLAGRLRTFARGQGVTPFIAMLAAFFVLLRRSSGGDEAVVGSGLANRRLREFDDMLGMFINTVALRADLSGDPTVAELLGRVRTVVLEAQENQDVPFPRVVEAVAPARSASHAPLYQTLFSFADAPLPALDAPGLAIVPDESPGNGSAKADINVVVVNHDRRDGEPAELTVIWEYNSDLFSAETAERMVDQYERLLEAMVTSPDRRVSELVMLSEQERRRVLAGWNETATEYPRDATIHELFADVARRHADDVAVVAGDERVTYGELDRRARRLADELRAQGVTPGSRVGIEIGRSIEMVVALLAVLGAGAAYVPLDPRDPRRDFVVRDAGVSLVLDAEALDGQGAGASAEGETAPVGAEDPAYVMYTSGSTGDPKGVLVSHRNVVRLVAGQRYVDFGPGQTFLQMAPLAFDASTFEIWGPLLNGGRLVMYPHEEIGIAELGATLERFGITTLWLTAALFHEVVASDLSALGGLAQLVAGGDVLRPDHVTRARRELRGARLVNGYGPTEATTFSCCFEVPAGWSGESVPIGGPIANTTAYVLDPSLEPVPIGVRGELYIGGDGVALGYLNRPDLTAERFVSSPFREGERLYRTGDFVRRRPDGTLEFGGRDDLQVKVRGFRVEPGEIEVALAAHPGVREAAVVADEDERGDHRLRGFVAADPGVGESELRAYLADRVPAYMIPSELSVVERLPVTPNGKLDRDALAAQAAAIPAQPSGPAGELTPTEEVVAGIWAHVLGLDAVAADDDFFASGGHSLQALRLIHDLNEACGVELPVRSVLIAPTVAELALEVERARQA